MRRLPEPIETAVYWLNASGRSLVADQLALWADITRPVKLAYEQRQEAERLLERVVADEDALRELVYEVIYWRDKTHD